MEARCPSPLWNAYSPLPPTWETLILEIGPGNEFSSNEEDSVPIASDFKFCPFLSPQTIVTTEYQKVNQSPSPIPTGPKIDQNEDFSMDLKSCQPSLDLEIDSFKSFEISALGWDTTKPSKKTDAGTSQEECVFLAGEDLDCLQHTEVGDLSGSQENSSCGDHECPPILIRIVVDKDLYEGLDSIQQIVGEYSQKHYVLPESDNSQKIQIQQYPETPQAVAGFDSQLQLLEIAMQNSQEHKIQNQGSEVGSSASPNTSDTMQQRLKPKQKRFFKEIFQTFTLRADVVLKTIFRRLRKYYLHDFYSYTSYKIKSKNSRQCIFKYSMHSYIRSEQISSLMARHSLSEREVFLCLGAMFFWKKARRQCRGAEEREWVERIREGLYSFSSKKLRESMGVGCFRTILREFLETKAMDCVVGEVDQQCREDYRAGIEFLLKHY